MSERRLEQLLRQPAPGEDEATPRSYEVARAAFESRPAAPARRGRIGALAPGIAVAAVLASVVAIVLTPAGGAIANLIREGLRDAVEGERPAEPALTSLPSGGELILVSERGPWVVRADGSQRLLGSYDEASWSPSGMFVAVSDGRQLSAVTPTGEPRWSVTRPSPVSGARWSPFPGYRVAYLSGGSLRVVEGDGTDDALEARHVAPTPPAWLPRVSGPHVLAYADRSGRVHVVDVDTGRSLWRSEPGERPVQLAWSGDGERLLAVGREAVRVFDGDGRLLHAIALPAGLPAAAGAGGHAAAFGRDGHEFALVRSSSTPGQSEVVTYEAEERPGRARELFSGPGSFSGLAWSSDGTSVLLAWPSADQLLFLRPDRPRDVTPVSNVARQFDPGAGGDAAFPRIADWCCSP